MSNYKGYKNLLVVDVKSKKITKYITTLLLVSISLLGCANMKNDVSSEDSRYESFITHELSLFPMEEDKFEVKLPKDYIIRDGIMKSILLVSSEYEERNLTINRRIAPTVFSQEYYKQSVEYITKDDNYKGEIIELKKIKINGYEGMQGIIRYLDPNSNGKYMKQVCTIIKTNKSVVDIILFSKEKDFDNYIEEFLLITNSFKEID